MEQSSTINSLVRERDSNFVEAHLVRIAWAVILLIGGFFRLYELGLTPLSLSEATEALTALDGANIAVSSTSGLLTGANHFLFWLLGTGNGAARLLPAIAGAMIPLSVLLIGRLGRYGALAAGSLLALCPSAVFLSRTVSPVIPGVAAALFLMGALENYRDGDNRWLLAAGVALGLGIGAGAAFLSMILVMLVAMLATRSDEIRNTLGQLDKLIWPAGIALVLGSTCYMFYPEALGATADGIAFWLAGFSLDFDQMLHLFRLLAVYEPFILLLGIIGLGFSLLEKNKSFRLFYYWFLIGLILALSRPGQADAPFLILVPLALLGGSIVERVVREYKSAIDIQEYKAGFLGATAALSILFVHIFISLGQYARYIISLDESGLQHASTSLLLVGISLIMIVGVASLVWTYSRKLSLTSLLAALILFFTFYSLGRAWELGHTHQADPREYWVGEYATAPGAYLLVDTLETVSQRSTGMRWDIPLTVQVNEPLMHWLLRDFNDVTWVDTLQSTIITEAVITPAEEENPILGDSYLGIDFSLQLKEQITADDETPGSDLRWLLLRDRSDPVGVNPVVLWIRQDIALTSQE